MVQPACNKLQPDDLPFSKRRKQQSESVLLFLETEPETSNSALILVLATPGASLPHDVLALQISALCLSLSLLSPLAEVPSLHHGIQHPEMHPSLPILCVAWSPPIDGAREGRVDNSFLLREPAFSSFSQSSRRIL